MSKTTRGNRGAAGAGTIRKKTVVRNSKEYTYWEARCTVGYDPGTGRQVQRSITGKTQQEVAQKLRQVTAEIDQGTYKEPCKLTLKEWLTIWTTDYLGGVKPHTVVSYKGAIANHICPAIGAIRLEELNAHTIQRMYNSFVAPKNGMPGLSPKTVKNIHGVLHKALQQAVKIGYIRFNPADACELPKVYKKEIKPLNEEESKKFLNAIRGHRFETLYTVTLFTGMREGEVLGLTWDCVDFEHGTLQINKQLQREKKKNAQYHLVPTKNSKRRLITPAPWVMKLLKDYRVYQIQQRLKAGPLWENSDLVFTNEIGHHLAEYLVYRDFKKIVAAIGRPDARFHDLRHSYAVAALRSGDDVKSVQANLGHATASFTLDVYGHVTDQMKKESAARMEQYIKGVLNL